MTELFAACITSIDIIVVYTFIQMKEGKFKLACWTALFNMVFPFLGFITGELSAYFFSEWTGMLSGVLLALIGIHMLLQDEETGRGVRKVHPIIIALAVSVDTFSGSVSFGMLQLNRTIFIMASGFFSFTISMLALHFKNRLGIKDGKLLRRFAGLVLLAMGIMSCIR